MADVSGGRSAAATPTHCPGAADPRCKGVCTLNGYTGQILDPDCFRNAERAAARPPVGDTTQPQPTDDANWSDPSQVPSKSRKLSRKSSSSGPDFVGAVAEIRALHRPQANFQYKQHLRCAVCNEPHPCSTIAALDKAWC